MFMYGQKTLYVAKRNIEVINRAAELLEFHEGISLSEFMALECIKIVQKYDKRLKIKAHTPASGGDV